MASLCTLMVPGELSCQQQGCCRRACRGNNMVEEPAGLVLELSHHKMERHHRQHPPLRLLLPREVATSVRTFVQHARPVLLLRATREADLDTPYLLVSDSGVCKGAQRAMATLPGARPAARARHRSLAGPGAGGGRPADRNGLQLLQSSPPQVRHCRRLPSPPRPAPPQLPLIGCSDSGWDGGGSDCG